MEKTIQEIAQQLGIAVTEVIPYYANWYIYASIAYICLGFGIMGLGFFLYKKTWEEDDTDRQAFAYMWLVIGFVIGAIIICAQIGDLLSPTGVAYHRLISDIRGN